MEEMFFCPSCMAKTAPEDGKCPICGSDVNIQNAPHQLPVNTILNGRYLVGKVLGAGGFGITYIGYDLKLDSKVAVKEYYPSGAANRSVSMTVFPTTEVKGSPFEIGKDRFLKEAKTLSEFVGEGNIVTLRDYFEEHGTAYIVMEYLEGEDLSHYAKEHGKFELGDALDLLEPAMLALDKVHKKGLIHRDISPSNIMVMSDGRVKVLDFGSARLQNASGELSLSIMLKPGYAPAEQYSTHGEQGPWTDVYAMSATVYKLLTGKTPPPSTDRILDDTIELPSSLGVKITPEQEAALMRGLALRVPDRTQTMAELAKGLREGLPVSDKKPEKKAKAKKSEKPKKRLFIIAAAMLGILAAAYITVPKAIDEANHKRLAAARDAISGHSETTISAGSSHTVGLKSNGTVIAVGKTPSEQSDISDWEDIVAVSTRGSHTVGLKLNGTVTAVGANDRGECKVFSWKNMTAVSAGMKHTVGLRADGTAAAVGENDSGQCDVFDWTDIVAVSAGYYHTVGLKSDGTVVAVGDNTHGQCNVSDWNDIVAVSADNFNTVGLKADGTVVVAGSSYYGEADVSDWSDIVAVSAGYHHAVGLKSSGTVVAVGDNSQGQCDVSGWSDIVAVSAGYSNTVGLKSDETVVAVGNNSAGQSNVLGWTDINLPGENIVVEPEKTVDDASPEELEKLAAGRAAIAEHQESTISVGSSYTLGLKSDGTVTAVGNNKYGQCSISAWKDIVAVSAGAFHAVGLRADGTVVAAGYNEDSQCDVSGWSDIVAVSAGHNHTVGLKSDGTVVAAGSNKNGQCNVSEWTDIVAVSAGFGHTVGLRADGIVVAVGDNGMKQCKVQEWKDIVAVSAGWDHTIGLRSDGTVVTAGDNAVGQCDVSAWQDIVAISAGCYYTVGLKSDGTSVAAGMKGNGQSDVYGWTDIIALSTGDSHTVGLKSDGTVVGVGLNIYGQCDVSDWTNIKLP